MLRCISRSSGWSALIVCCCCFQWTFLKNRLVLVEGFDVGDQCSFKLSFAREVKSSRDSAAVCMKNRLLFYKKIDIVLYFRLVGPRSCLLSLVVDWQEVLLFISCDLTLASYLGKSLRTLGYW